jgi:Fe-S-cluster-containing hydrogenase component 2
MDDVERKFGTHVVQYPPEVSLCAGCSACEVVCGLVHEGVSSPSLRRIYLERNTTQMIHTVRACQHCLDRPCYNACPKKDSAMRIDGETGVTWINAEHCIGCKLCVKACPFEPKRIGLNLDKPRPKAIKCDLCRTRPEGPACIEFCQVRCIGLSTMPVPLE